MINLKCVRSVVAKFSFQVEEKTLQLLVYELQEFLSAYTVINYYGFQLMDFDNYWGTSRGQVGDK